MLLKKELRELLFYNDEYSASSMQQNEQFCEGPFRPINAIETLFEMHKCFISDSRLELFEMSISAEELKSAWSIFCDKNNFGLIPKL